MNNIILSLVDWRHSIYTMYALWINWFSIQYHRKPKIKVAPQNDNLLHSARHFTLLQTSFPFSDKMSFLAALLRFSNQYFDILTSDDVVVFAGSIASPFCAPMDCPLELWGETPSQLTRGCIPVYLSAQGCCPVMFRCREYQVPRGVTWQDLLTRRR